MIDTIGRVIAWAMLVISMAGFFLSMFGVVGKGEPKQVLLLSWAALLYAAFVAVQEDRHNAG